ncbi:MAG: FIST N-terminal domain-containing protein [Bacteroidota bacterium]
MKQLPSQILETTSSDEHTAVLELKNNLNIDSPAAIIFFCSSQYDLDVLAVELNANFKCKILGCTTSGELARAYKSAGIVALVFSMDIFVVHSLLIENVNQFELADAMKLVHTVERDLQYSSRITEENMFGFLMADGLSMKEEILIARLNQAFDGINIFGGSAGDDLKFDNTYVFFEGKFYTQSALLLIIELKCDYTLFKTQHFIPTHKELITTEVDFEKRLVKEINGEPAANAFAEINNLDVNNLTATDFAIYPLMMNISGEWYIRSIASVNSDKSLQFYCAIDDGLPLSVAKGQDMLTRLEEETSSIIDDFEEIYFTLGCDCILRKVENLNNETTSSFKGILSKLNFIGFNSYGEQYKGVHFNQTLVAVVVGKKRNG